jgi:hypothetical protein
VRPFEDNLAGRAAYSARDCLEDGVNGAPRVHGDRPFLFDPEARQCLSGCRTPCVKGKGKVREKENRGRTRGCHKLRSRCRALRKVPRRPSTTRSCTGGRGSATPFFSECTRAVSRRQRDWLTHLVHCRKDFTHFDDTPQPFEGKVADANAPTAHADEI